MHLSPWEAFFIKKFFCDVDYYLTQEIDRTNSEYEDILTFSLGALLADSPALPIHKSYSVSDLNQDLMNIGSDFEVEFSIKRHDRVYENRRSNSDMGIILWYPDETGEMQSKAILVQCKRLHKNRNNRYTIGSNYGELRGNQHRQYKRLRKYCRDHPKSVYYFLYNPSIASFYNNAPLRILQYENHEFVDEVTVFEDEYSHYYDENGVRDDLTAYPGNDVVNDELIRNIERYKSFKPGLKVIGMEHLIIIVGHHHRRRYPTIGECYEQRTQMENELNCYRSFASFIVDSFLSCHSGTTDMELMGIANGEPSELLGNGGGPNVEEKHNGNRANEGKKKNKRGVSQTITVTIKSCNKRKLNIYK